MQDAKPREECTFCQAMNLATAKEIPSNAVIRDAVSRMICSMNLTPRGPRKPSNRCTRGTKAMSEGRLIYYQINSFLHGERAT
eukprot:5405103-Amphidinium_carterae.1